MSIRVNTIGFTKTSAEHFFSRLQEAEIRRLIDVRLNNTSQLAGFAKAEDLRFFVKRICGAEYAHYPILAPTDEMLRKFKKEKGDWSTYRREFLDLMGTREIECRIKKEELDGSCLLCSEAEPHYCHRSLICEYLNRKWDTTLIIRHL